MGRYHPHVLIKVEKMMTKNVAVITVMLGTSILMSGCFNMPTPPTQITGTYTSGLKYEEYSCERLTVERDSLARRENQLNLAQEQRIKNSKMQAFWLGYGQGDGIEASELASVRGELEAVRKTLAGNNCGAIS